MATNSEVIDIILRITAVTCILWLASPDLYRLFRRAPTTRAAVRYMAGLNFTLIGVGLSGYALKNAAMIPCALAFLACVLSVFLLCPFFFTRTQPGSTRQKERGLM